MPFQMDVWACHILPVAAFAVWVAVILTGIALVRGARALPKPMRALFLVLVLIVGQSSSAWAYWPTPDHCYWLWASGTPCWMLQALWCPCDPGPPPPPPPPG